MNSRGRFMGLLALLGVAWPGLGAMPQARVLPVVGAGKDSSVSGPVVLQLILPEGRTGKSEPLLSCGRPGRGDIVFIHYLAPQLIAIGWEETGFGIVLSKAIELRNAGPHELAVALGSMIPGAGDRTRPPPPRWEMLRRTTSIRFDGKMLMEIRHALPSDLGEATATLGLNTIGGTMAAARFSGRITGVRAWDYDEDMRGAGQLYPGPVCMYLRFPTVIGDRAEPLLTTGRNGAGDVLYVKYVDEGHVRFGLDHWDVGGPVSELVANEPGQRHEVVMSLDSVMPPPGKDGIDYYSVLRSRCIIMCDGRIVLDAPGPFYPSTPSQIMLAANPIGASSCGLAFTGVLNETGPADNETVARLFNPSTWTDKQALTLDGRDYPGPVRMQVKFDSGRLVGGEPVVVTGKAGVGDILFVHYEGRNRLRFGLDHWGYGGPSTEVLEVDPKKLHELVVSMDPLLPPPYPDEPDRFARLRSRCIVILDGRILLNAQNEFFAAAPAQIWIGFNPIGGSTADIGFTGDLKHVARMPVAELLRALP